VILADEPVASLDPERGAAVLDLLSRVCRESGKTLLVSLHQVELARSRFARIIGLRAGRVVFDGPPARLSPDVIARPVPVGRAAVGDARIAPPPRRLR
jgi:phosphonate transport system ATP-binding protein